MSLAAFGSLATDENDSGRAARLCGAAESLLERIGAVMVLTDPADLERTVAAGRAQLGEEGFAAAWAEGRRMSLEQAVAYATSGLTGDG